MPLKTISCLCILLTLLLTGLLSTCSPATAPADPTAPLPTHTAHPSNIRVETPTSPAPTVPAQELPIQSRDYEVGTAGLFARNYPHSTQDDYQAFIEELPLTGERLGVYVDWQAPDLLESIAFAVEYAEGVEPLVAVGFNHEQVDDAFFTEHGLAYKERVLEVVDTYTLDYLAVGIEVNRVQVETSQDAFLDFVALYREIYDAVKEISPHTRVFTIFQLEYLKGAATLSGLSFEPQWEVLDLFEGKLDLVGLTVYPFLEVQTVSDIPEDYYDEVPLHIDLPIAITEMAWLSEDVMIVEGSQEAQVVFLLGLLAGTRDWELVMMLYSFLYEPAGVELFDSAALKTNQGEEKEVYSYWRALAALKRE